MLVARRSFTRIACVIPINNKTANSVCAATIKIIKSPYDIECDQGSEFISKGFKIFIENNNTVMRYVDIQSHHPLGVVDRTCRTLRSSISKYSTA